MDNGGPAVLELGRNHPSFLYFELLRVQQQLWSQTVIWTSLLGTFLTVIGIALGVVQFKPAAGAGCRPIAAGSIGTMWSGWCSGC